MSTDASTAGLPLRTRLRELRHRTLYPARSVLASNESAFMAYAAVRYRARREELVDRETEIVIEGFPRSGNTFATVAFLSAQGRPVKVGHHTHAAGHVRRAVHLGIPTLVVVRDPVDSAVSNMLRFDVSAKAALDAWVRFHEVIAPSRRGIVVGRFDEVTTDLGAVIARVNGRFGTAFARFEPTPENVERVFEMIDERNRSHFGTVVETAVPRPSVDREAHKTSTRARVMAPELEDLRARATASFERLIETGSD